MKPEDKVCTPEQSQKLMELGLDLETEKEWWIFKDGTKTLNPRVPAEVVISMSETPKIYSACDIAELDVLLSDEFRMIKLDRNRYRLEEVHRGCLCGMPTESWLPLLFGTRQFETEAQAKAEGIIWLIKNKYLKPEDLKL